MEGRLRIGGHIVRNMPRKPKTALSPTETVCIIAQLYDHYGLDRSPARDRSQDGSRAEQALYRAAQDGLLRPPPRKRGPPLKWQGKLNLELVEAVESVRLETFDEIGDTINPAEPGGLPWTVNILRQ